MKQTFYHSRNEEKCTVPWQAMKVQLKISQNLWISNSLGKFALLVPEFTKKSNDIRRQLKTALLSFLKIPKLLKLFFFVLNYLNYCPLPSAPKQSWITQQH